MQLRKSCFALAVLLLIAGILIVPAYSEIDNSVFDRPQRPASLFDHDEHNEKAGLEDDCALCHHVYEGKVLVEDESSEDSMCSDCHSIKATAENSVPLRAAFHKRCRSCHFDKKSGPVLCGECHIKKERKP